ncbi:MAG: class I SAM-dependent methyltransferase, partial [Candidatus Aminicenantes bacterium]|nr:class I SAM-dependent methyltransferase [Candidatus Aminicenantes bacterium]
QERPLDVPYVPSRPEVVEEMLRMARVNKSDVLYDLGCGDGRIVITAAKLYGTRGVGIDIDPDRIRESQENAALAGVTHLVKFIEQDLFEADFHEATVVSLYLLTSVNVRLRPRLVEQLKPGTRIVSHNYGMNAWKPDQSSVVMVNDMPHDVYFWIVPANVSGTWEWSWPDVFPDKPFRLKVEQLFQWPQGEMTVGDEELLLKDIFLEGDRFRFTVERESGEGTMTMAFEGRVRGHSIDGEVRIQGGGKTNNRPWKAIRNPATMKPLDVEDDELVQPFL